MNFLKKYSPWAMIAFGCTTLACTARPPSDPGEVPPEILLEGVGLRFFRGNELRAVGHAEEATFLRDTADGTAQRVRMRFLAQDDRPEVLLVAHQVAGNVRDQQAAAQGGVRVAVAGGATGVTERARLDGPGRRATGDDPVDLDDVGYHVHSDKGFLLNLAAPGGLALQGPIQTIVGGSR